MNDLSPDQRTYLEELRALLQRQSLFPEDTAGKAAQSLANFLDGKSTSLDGAFGLVAANHRPKDKSRLDIAREVHELRKGGKTWLQVADYFDAGERRITDESSLRDLYKEFKNRLHGEDIAARLKVRGDK
jgi:hypothetical protein